MQYTFGSFLSRQVNYNQVVMKCQILQECFLQNFNIQKFQNMEHSNSRTFRGLSRAGIVSKIQGLSRTLWTPPQKKVQEIQKLNTTQQSRQHKIKQNKT